MMMMMMTKFFFIVLGGPIFRLKGSILSMSFLDCNGALIPYSYEAWKDENRGGILKLTKLLPLTAVFNKHSIFI